jgi:hypothetical protein
MPRVAPAFRRLFALVFPVKRTSKPAGETPALQNLHQPGGNYLHGQRGLSLNP